MAVPATVLKTAIPCPVCNGPHRPLFEKAGYEIRECLICGHQLVEIPDGETHVRQVYDDTYFTGGGAGYTDYLREGEILRAAGRRYGRLLARYFRPGRLLDVGCAAGFLLKGFEDTGWQGLGVDPNSTMVRFARDRLGLRAVAGTLEDLDVDETFDAVSLIQVMGHFRDPRLALETAAAKLRPGGGLLVECWNRKSRTARLFGRNWHEYSPPSVLHWFSIEGIRALAEAIGLEFLETGRPVKRMTAAHAKSLIRYKLPESPSARAVCALLKPVPDGLPLVYPFDDLFWAAFRKPG